MIDIHNYNRKLEREIQSVKNSNVISTANKNQILKFVDDCLAESITKGRIARCITDLKNINRLLKADFKNAKLEHIKKLVARIEQEAWTDWTKYGIKVTIKKFFRWLHQSEEYPALVKWIKPRIKNNRMILPEDLLNENDIKALVNSARNPRDKALIMTLYESGCRVGEILTLKIKNLQFDDYGAQLIVNGKTGQRRVRIISATPFLSDWINNHPIKDSNSPLWMCNGNKAMSYSHIGNLLKRTAMNAGISKRVNPHSFRHSRATYLANHLTEAQMKEHFGWVQGSDMASVYVHLSGRDVDKALLKTYGISIDENRKEGSDLKPIDCPRCKEINHATNKFCQRCGMVIDEQMKDKIIQEGFKRKEMDQMLEKMLNSDEKFRKMFMESWGKAFEKLSQT